MQAEQKSNRYYPARLASAVYSVSRRENSVAKIPRSGSCEPALAGLVYLGNRGEDFVSKPSDLIQGTLDMLILKIVALEPLNGWAISQRLKQISSDILGVSDGSLYPALHKLEHRGLIRAAWKSSENNRRAKFYSLTGLGRKQLEKETANWNRVSAAIAGIVRLNEA